MKKYFIIINGQQSGPFSLEELFDRHITSETLVWAEGMQNWTPAWEIEELKDILRGIDPRSSAYNGTTTPNEQGVTLLHISQQNNLHKMTSRYYNQVRDSQTIIRLIMT